MDSEHIETGDDEEVEEMEDDVVDDDSDSGSENEREEQYALERKVVELRKELVKTPNAYNMHIELIASLKQLGELDQLRHARETMHFTYPLSQELWLEWLRDEIALSSTPEDNQKIESLFKRATQDYLNVDIWMEYIQFSLTGLNMSGAEDIKKIRSVMEEAVRHGGLHVAKGALLWDSYRDFELAIYETTKLKDDKDSSTSQAQLITQLFHRQLTVPLLDMERTWTEYAEWMQTLGQEPESYAKASYEKAKGYLEKISPIEDTLLIAVEDADKAIVYRTYLDLETNDIKNPARIQALYERILAEMPLYDIFWIDYCHYVDNKLKVADAAIPLYNRAIRNCPWNSTLWSDYIFAAQKYGKDHSFIAGLVEKAFAAGLSSAADCKAVWLAFIEYLVRKSKWDDADSVQQLREAFTRATDYLFQSFDTEGDPECLLLQYWAYIETKKLGNMPKARELWQTIMNQGHNKSAQWWLAYIQFERTHGNDVALVRKLFAKGLSKVPSTDWPESLAQQWLQFEREEGDFQTMQDAREKCEMRMKKVAEERGSQTAAEDDSKPKGQKRTKNDDNQESKSHPAKKAKTSNAPTSAATPNGNGKIERPKAVPTVAETPPIVPQPPADPNRHARTVFLSNLDFGIVEDEIRATMCASGTITEIRLIRDYKQRSKGYCYVEFSNQLEAKAALKRDREPLKGRPMFISPSEPDAALKIPVFKFQNTLEKKKLFVKGLAPATTKEDLEQLFGKYGTLKDVRIVTYRSGASKGLAYVEFEDDVSAATALMKTDGTTFQEREITVALSNPPPRHDKTSLMYDKVLRQTQSMMPPPPPSGSAAAPKSNADFRSMLLSKK